jgi:hypothetical protein
MISITYKNTDSTARMGQEPLYQLPADAPVGKKFNQLTVVDRVANDPTGKIQVRCTCECGQEAIVRLSYLRTGHTKSCGCFRAKSVVRRLGKVVLTRFGILRVLGKSEGGHGITRSTEWVACCIYCHRFHFKTTHQLRRRDSRCPCLEGTYNSWRAAIQRCTNPTHAEYRRYGGRGITVCPEWRNSFAQFVWDMGKRPVGKTLDRFPDPDGPYAPGNCRWATPAQQAQNRDSGEVAA